MSALRTVGVDSVAVNPTDQDERSLPDLRFVPVESLVPHEQHDDQRLGPLVALFRKQGELRNPPVVTPLPFVGSEERRYMVLDGANRSSAARAAGLPHIVVQVVRYDGPGVRLTTWYHALANLTHAELEDALRGIDGLTWEETNSSHARALLARREALAWIAHHDGRVVTLHGGADLHGRNALLNQVVDAYRVRTRFYRVTEDSIDDARARHHDVTALVVFPQFAPDEVVELATSGARLPAGITRHLIRWRALRVNVPMEKLADRAKSVDDKNRWLADWLKHKLAERQVRFYEEPTVLFDE